MKTQKEKQFEKYETMMSVFGELDENTLFYFESRGIPADEAENIMARAAIERLARTLDDETAQSAVLAELEEVL